MNGKCFTFIFRGDGYYHPQVNCYYQCSEKKRKCRFPSTMVSPAPIWFWMPLKNRGHLVICHYVFYKLNQLQCRKAAPEASGMQQLCRFVPVHTQPARITDMGVESPGTKDHSLVAMIWISVWIQTLALVGKAAVTQLWLLTEAAKASTESQWTVSRHQTNFSCLLCLVKLLFSSKLRILGLFSSTITWKNTSIFKRTVPEETQSVTWLFSQLCRRLGYCRRGPNATGTLQILEQRWFITIHWRLFQLLWSQNITGSSTLAIFCFVTENYQMPDQIFLTLKRENTLDIQSRKDRSVCNGH